MRWSEPSLPHDAGPPTIKNHSVTYHDGLLYCFGGYDGRRNHMTLLIYSIKDQRWLRPAAAVGAGGATVHGDNGVSSLGLGTQGGGRGVQQMGVVSGTPPPGRNGHTATLATSGPDEEDGRIIIIGGWLGSGPLAASDMHVLDVSGGAENLRWYQPAVRGTPPGPCNMHSADYVPGQREVYVFRGGNGREYLNDLHALNVSTYEWRKVETTGTSPQQRANHSSAVLEETGELFIFGGWNGKERLNDIHILDTATSTWSCPHVGGVLPHPRAGMTLTALRGRLYLFGGSGTSSKCFQDLQILDRKEMAWLDVMQNEDSSPLSNYYQHEGKTENDEYHSQGGPSTSSHHRHSISTVGHQIQSGGEGGSSPLLSRHQSIGDGQSLSTMAAMGGGGFRSHTDWRSRELGRHPSHGSVGIAAASPNPNDEDTVATIFIQGHGPGRRAGHTATAVNRHIYVFGGSCGSDYLNDFFVLDTDPPPRASVTESTSLELFGRRLAHFFNDEEFSDVTFLVEGQRVYGHRMVLSLVSDCFRAMFTTGFRESEAGAEIEIPHCSHDAFLAMMKYIYTGQTPNVGVGNEEDGGINGIVDLLELADQFFLDHLKQVCERMLQPAVNSDTVENLLQVAQKTNAAQLEAICLHFERNREI